MRRSLSRKREPRPATNGSSRNLRVTTTGAGPVWGVTWPKSGWTRVTVISSSLPPTLAKALAWIGDFISRAQSPGWGAVRRASARRTQSTSGLVAASGAAKTGSTSTPPRMA